MTFFGNPEGQDIAGLTLAVCGVRGEQLEPGGTCFLITQSIAITAKHVINDIDQRLNPGRLSHGRNELRYSIQVSGSEESGFCLFDAVEVFLCPISDLAILLLQPRNQANQTYNVLAPVVNFDPPLVGSEIFTFGFANQMTQIIDGRVVWQGEPIPSSGKVTQYFPAKRDTGMLTFPSFETDAKIVGHMSGSPFLNSKGEIVGVVVSSFEDGESGVPVSWGAALWPLLCTALFDGNTLGGEEDRYLFDLYVDRTIHGKNWNHPQYNRKDQLFLSSRPTQVNGAIQFEMP